MDLINSRVITCISVLLIYGRCQDLPSLDEFLMWLLDVTSGEIQNLANDFKFQDVGDNNVTFILYLPNSTNQTLEVNFTNVQAIDISKPTKFIIHGWQASGADDEAKNLAKAYHKRGDYNVIAVDWSKYSKNTYFHAASRTKDVGNIIGGFVMGLTKEAPGALENMHLIGHSLGAHVAGFAGKRIFETTGKKIGRITGLDVAAPMFEIPTKTSADNRLDKEDAKLVDVIHTNGGFLGFSEPVGTVDFYVENGGPLQPECFNINIFESFACSHLKAFEYFRDSIVTRKFEALSCQNSINYHILACNNNEKIVMGEDTPQAARGTFFLEADSALPYLTRLLDISKRFLGD